LCHKFLILRDAASTMIKFYLLYSNTKMMHQPKPLSHLLYVHSFNNYCLTVLRIYKWFSLSFLICYSASKCHHVESFFNHIIVLILIFWFEDVALTDTTISLLYIHSYVTYYLSVILINKWFCLLFISVLHQHFQKSNASPSHHLKRFASTISFSSLYCSTTSLFNKN